MVDSRADYSADSKVYSRAVMMAASRAEMKVARIVLMRAETRAELLVVLMVGK